MVQDYYLMMSTLDLLLCFKLNQIFANMNFESLEVLECFAVNNCVVVGATGICSSWCLCALVPACS